MVGNVQVEETVIVWREQVNVRADMLASSPMTGSLDPGVSGVFKISVYN
jgi:hypothetical protein